MLSDKFQDNCSAVVLAGVIGQQGDDITPSWHLTHLWYIQGSVFAMHSFIFFFTREIDYGSLSLPFHLA